MTVRDRPSDPTAAKTAAGPVSVAQVRTRAARLVERDLRTWATSAEVPVLTVALRPPTERQVLDRMDAARVWVDEWRAAERQLPVQVEWVERRWASVGTQRVPTRATVSGSDAVAEMGGAVTRAAWTGMRDRIWTVRHRLGLSDYRGDSVILADEATVLRRHAGTLATLPEHDFGTLLGVVAWLSEHPASGLRVRQVPVRGIDTKWLEAHLTLVTALHRLVTGKETLGLLPKEELVRVRFLDERLAVGSPRDLAATAAGLAALDVAARLVLVLENLETLLSLPSMPGVVAIHGSGNAVASRLRPVGWVRRAPVVYWGDLDTYGFQILARLREEHDDVRSVLMDVETLLRCRDLWVPDAEPARVKIEQLDAGERAALALLHAEGDVRLEQERVPWAYAWEVLREVLG